MRVLLVLTLLLAGCSLAHVNQPASPRHALVQVARTPEGKPTVILRAIHSKHRLRSQDIDMAETVTLRPGTYIAEVECSRSGGHLFLHMFPTFRFTVQAGRTYDVDCSPTPDSDGFFLQERPNNSFKPKPLRGSA